jgi:flagellin
MALNIQSQVRYAQQTARLMAMHTARQERAGERASSGYRINRASDDAAGLSISESLRAQVRGSAQAGRNLLDGMSLLNTADAAISQIADSLHRMRELAVQSANGVYDAQQRQSMELEFAELRREINYVTTEANFNNFYLLRGGEPNGMTTATRTVSQGSAGPTDTFTVTPQTLSFASGALGTNGLGESTASLGAAVPEDYGLGTGGPQSIAVTAFDSATGTTRTIPADATNGFDYNAGTNQLTFHGTGAPLATETLQVRYVPLGSTTRSLSRTPLAGSEAVTANGAPVANAGGPAGNGYYLSGNTLSLVGTARPDAAGGAVTLVASYLTPSPTTNTIALDTETAGFEGGVLDPASLVVTVDGVAVPADPVNGYSIIQTQVDQVGLTTPLYTYAIQLNGASKLAGAGPHAFSVTYDFDYPTGVDPLDFILQAGADNGMTQELIIDRLTVGGLGLGASHVDTQARAQTALDALNTALDRMNLLRARIGAYESSLDHAYAYVQNQQEQQDSAQSRIRDADMADEISESARHTILQGGAMAVFTQIHTNANYLLKLLQA